MKKILSLFIAISALGVLAAGQCVEKKAKAWRGMELGMTKDAALAKFPDAKGKASLTGDEIKRYPEFADLSAFFYRISNDKVDKIQAMFSGEAKVDIKTLTARIASEFGLTENAFAFTPYSAKAKCATFTLEVNSSENMFTLTDHEGEAYWKKVTEANERKN